MMYVYLILAAIVIGVIWTLSPTSSYEHFESGRVFDPSTHQFDSLKSAIKNFNETTDLTGHRNQVQGHSSQLVDRYQQTPDWIHPYTYINREFTTLLLKLVTQIERDSNFVQNEDERQGDFDRADPEQTLLTLAEKYHSLADSKVDFARAPPVVRKVISELIAEINRRFNTVPPIVDFKPEEIKYKQLTPNDYAIQVEVFKAYNAADIKYYEYINPFANHHLDHTFPKTLLIIIDQINPVSPMKYRLRYLRLLGMDYPRELPYMGDVDNRFYLGRSKQPDYHMLQNTQARNIYLQQFLSKSKPSEYKCFAPRQFIQKKRINVEDQTTCEIMQGIWERKCQEDADCPYYQSNKLYKNNYGGCDRTTGYCQLPVGVKSLSYRQPKNSNDALCYGCVHGLIGKGTIGPCCGEQLKPDFHFEGDAFVRYQNRHEIEGNRGAWSAFAGGPVG